MSYGTANTNAVDPSWCAVAPALWAFAEKRRAAFSITGKLPAGVTSIAKPFPSAMR